MNSEIREENSMGELLKDFDVKRIKSGDILKGTVIDVNDKEVSVNINYAFDGVISREELSNSDASPIEIVKPGDVMDVYVLSPNDGEGYVQLSRIRALQITEKKDLEDAFKNNSTIKVIVKEEVKGGLVAYYGSLRVFIPGSQASRARIELKELINKELEVKLIELDIRNRKVVASRRVIEEEAFNASKKELWKTVKSGEKREGVVTKILKVGAIVDIGGVTGLIHISDLAWGRVKRVEDVVSVGDKVVVFVGNVDAENERVSLVLKDVNNEPWNLHKESLKEGNVLEGKVAKLMNFGAFVEVFPGVEGLVHINEITDENIAKPSEAVEVGQTVKVKVLSLDLANKKLSLSMREAEEKSEEYLAYNDNDQEETLGDLFKGLFNK